MNRLTIRSRVGPDGVVRVNVPVGAAEVDREVQVTIEPVARPAMTQAEWEQFILSTGGSISDPTFVRHDQGEYEQREEWP
jgi:hypothetical protein